VDRKLAHCSSFLVSALMSFACVRTSLPLQGLSDNDKSNRILNSTRDRPLSALRLLMKPRGFGVRSSVCKPRIILLPWCIWL
jgi:hypothetical protein